MRETVLQLLDHLQPIAADLTTAEKLELLVAVSEVAAWETTHPAINWPISPVGIIEVLTRKYV